MLQKINISNKHCSSDLSIYLWILRNNMRHSFHKNIVQHNIDNNHINNNESKAAGHDRYAVTIR